MARIIVTTDPSEQRDAPVLLEETPVSLRRPCRVHSVLDELVRDMVVAEMRSRGRSSTPRTPSVPL